MFHSQKFMAAYHFIGTVKDYSHVNISVYKMLICCLMSILLYSLLLRTMKISLLLAFGQLLTSFSSKTFIYFLLPHL